MCYRKEEKKEGRKWGREGGRDEGKEEGGGGKERAGEEVLRMLLHGRTLTKYTQDPEFNCKHHQKKSFLC
jgi:predicted transposase YdaD